MRRRINRGVTKSGKKNPIVARAIPITATLTAIIFLPIPVAGSVKISFLFIEFIKKIIFFSFHIFKFLFFENTFYSINKTLDQTAQKREIRKKHSNKANQSDTKRNETQPSLMNYVRTKKT
jgi:hypothetical protein